MDDAPAVFDAYARDPEVSRYLPWHPHTSLETTQAYLASCLASTRSRTYAITTDKALMGAVDLRQHEAWRSGFGYVIARPYWGNGLMSEALRALVEWALSQPGIWRINDVVDVGNVASARVMQKAGL